jgi:hypothetical protein
MRVSQRRKRKGEKEPPPQRPGEASETLLREWESHQGKLRPPAPPKKGEIRRKIRGLLTDATETVAM